MPFNKDDFGLESGSDEEKQPRGKSQVETLMDQIKEARREKSKADDKRKAAAEKLTQIKKLARSAKAIMEKNHNKAIRKLLGKVEEYKQTLGDNDEAQQEIVYSSLPRDEARAKVSELKKLRALKREKVMLAYQARELAVLTKSAQDSIDTLRKEISSFKLALDDDSQKDAMKKLEALKKAHTTAQTTLEDQKTQEQKNHTTITQLEAKIKTIEDENEARFAQVDPEKEQMKQDCKTTNENHLALVTKNKKMKEEIEEMNKGSAGLAEDLAKAKETVKETKKETSELKADRMSTEKGSKDAQAKMRKQITKQKKVVAEELKVVEAALKKKEKQLAELGKKAQVKFDQADASVTKIETELKKLADHLVKEEEKKVMEGEKQEGLKTKLQGMRTHGKEQGQALVGLAKDVKAMRTTLNEIRQECKAMDSFLPSLGPLIDGAVQKYVESQAENSGALMENYKKEMELRRHFFNQIQELKGNIRVYCRVRPMGHRESEDAANEGIVVFPSEGEMRIHHTKRKVDHMFEFEKIFTPKSTQPEVFAEVAELVISVLDGYNVCIFAYGQTGSGKTYTMEGPSSNPGVNKRALGKLFQEAQAKLPDIEYTIEITLLEIYNEVIKDLLGKDDDKLKAVQGKHGMEVHGLVRVTVTSVEEVWKWLAQGQKKRHTSETKMNDRSSRSHLVLSVYVNGVNTITGAKIHGKLHLIDLAGSERVGRSQVKGQAMKEAQNINSSLLALGNCIQARAQNQSHVPYRDSTLTRLLQDSLEKNSKTLMFVQISPADADVSESLCSLKFASRVRMVELGKASKNR